MAHDPAVVLTDQGALRFVVPLFCPTTQIVTLEHGVEVETRPNLATFIVGVIAAGVGGVLAVTGAASDDPVSDPLTWAGSAGLVVGAPLAIGPWLGNRSVVTAGGPATTEQRPGEPVPCGDRPLGARAAMLRKDGVEIYGAIAADGTFEVSPYQLVDALAPNAVGALHLTAIVDGVEVRATIDSAALTARAHAFLAHAGVDATIAPMRLVPGVVADMLRASLTSTASGDALRIVLPVRNDGPGDAYALRGYLQSDMRAIDGRVLYIGRLAKGASVTRELLIPLAHEDAAQLRGSTVTLLIELHDAHGTAPSTPVRFEGAVLGDAPR